MELKKTLTGAGAMISLGLFILPALAFRESGRGVSIAYALADVCMLPAVFTKLKLASAMSRSGGAFFYVSTYGDDLSISSAALKRFSISGKSEPTLPDMVRISQVTIRPYTLHTRSMKPLIFGPHSKGRNSGALKLPGARALSFETQGKDYKRDCRCVEDSQ